MGFTKKFNKDFYLKNDHIVLDKQYLDSNHEKFKKITGSRFAAILNLNKFTTPFKTWCIMTNIFVDEVDDTLMKAGVVIEPKIHKYVCELMNVNFKQYNPSEIKWDVFKENKIFGGIPDGEPVDEKGKLLYPDFPMLEIKTSSIDAFLYKKVKNDFVLQKNDKNEPIVKTQNEKRSKWFDSNGDIVIPDEYKFQLGLYCYLRNINKGVFAVCFLETNDYIHPELCDVKKREIKLVDFSLNLNEFQKYINDAEKWYNDYIKTGISPELSSQDLEWFNIEVNS